jgi:GNAT superfamily N-acetyltransferase
MAALNRHDAIANKLRRGHFPNGHRPALQVNIRNIPLSQARRIRLEVLRPGRPASEVAYPGDESDLAEHLGAFEGGQLVAIATFVPEACPGEYGVDAWHLRGMATVPAAQGRGVGSQLLSNGVARVLQRGAALIWCHGRTSARAFYERHAFRAIGDEFLIPHTGPHFLFIRGSGEIALAPSLKPRESSA